MPTSEELQRELRGLADSHRSLAGHLRAWLAGSPDPAAPSRLPGWTVGHVLTHLARNADGLRGMVEAAARGELADQYEGGAIGRTADIEAGAGRSAAELVDDVVTSAERLDTAFAASDWSGSGRVTTGAVLPVTEFPHRRWREVEIHRVDLGLGYEPEDWPELFVRLELPRQEMQAKSRLPMGMTTWPAAVLALRPARRLAWLVGRSEEPGLPELSGWG